MVIVDTTVWIDYLRGLRNKETDYLDRELGRNLRQRGQTVRMTIACLIATFCLRHGHSLLHRNRNYDHFEDFLGLAVIHP